METTKIPDQKEKERIESEVSAEIMDLYSFLQKRIGKYPSVGIIIEPTIRKHIAERIETSLNSIKHDLYLISYLNWRINMAEKANN